MGKGLSGKECIGEKLLSGEDAGKIDGPIDNGRRGRVGLDVEGCDYAEGVGGTAEGIVEIGIGGGGGMD